MRDYLWLVIHSRSGWGLLWLCLLIVCLDKYPLSSSDLTSLQPWAEALTGTKPVKGGAHSPWQPHGAHWPCLHCSGERTGSKACFCRKWQSINTWNNDSTFLRHMSGNMASAGSHCKTNIQHILLFFSINDQGQGHSHAFKRDVQMHVLLPLRHWVSVW